MRGSDGHPQPGADGWRLVGADVVEADMDVPTLADRVLSSLALSPGSALRRLAVSTEVEARIDVTRLRPGPPKRSRAEWPGSDRAIAFHGEPSLRAEECLLSSKSGGRSLAN